MKSVSEIRADLRYDVYLLNLWRKEDCRSCMRQSDYAKGLIKRITDGLWDLKCLEPERAQEWDTAIELLERAVRSERPKIYIIKVKKEDARVA